MPSFLFWFLIMYTYFYSISVNSDIWSLYGSISIGSYFGILLPFIFFHFWLWNHLSWVADCQNYLRPVLKKGSFGQDLCLLHQVSRNTLNHNCFKLSSWLKASSDQSVRWILLKTHILALVLKGDILVPALSRHQHLRQTVSFTPSWQDMFISFPLLH
jgi:hypothetical protein